MASQKVLGVALIVLLIDSAIEMALVSSMVGYLHRSGANRYPFVNPKGSISLINAKPLKLLKNEGHLSNGAAGTALVGICFGGFIVLFLQWRRQHLKSVRKPSRLLLAYSIFTILSFLLTVSALAATFVVAHNTEGQAINKAVAAQSQGHAYPLNQWTPETWTEAMLALPIDDGKDADYLRGWLRVMKGWKWNLIPLFLIGLVVAILSLMVYWEERLHYRGNGRSREEKHVQSTSRAL